MHVDGTDFLRVQRLVEVQTPANKLELHLVVRSSMAPDRPGLAHYVLDSVFPSPLHPLYAEVGVSVDSFELFDLLQVPP